MFKLIIIYAYVASFMEQIFYNDVLSNDDQGHCKDE